MKLKLREEKKLGKDSSLSVIALGLPNLEDVPRVKELIDTGEIKSWHVDKLTNLFNARLAESGFVFANIADVSFNSKLISSDGLHPTQKGYDAIAKEVWRSSLLVATGGRII